MDEDTKKAIIEMGKTAKELRDFPGELLKAFVLAMLLILGALLLVGFVLPALFPPDGVTVIVADAEGTRQQEEWFFKMMLEKGTITWNQGQYLVSEDLLRLCSAPFFVKYIPVGQTGETRYGCSWAMEPTPDLFEYREKR